MTGTAGVMPEGDPDPIPDIWDEQGRFSSEKAAAVFAETAAWPDPQRQAMLATLRAMEARADIEGRYAHPAEIAQAVMPEYVITPALLLIALAIETVLRSPRKINLLITMPPQEGKAMPSCGKILGMALDPDTLVLTPAQFLTVADIGPGDLVFHPDGHPIAVLAKTVVMRNRPMFRVETSDGRSLVVDEQHQWTVRDNRRSRAEGSGRVRGGPWETLTTAEIVDRGIYREKPRVRASGTVAYSYAFRLPRQHAVQIPARDDLPIPPYVLGLWLADGGQTAAQICEGLDDTAELTKQITASGVRVTRTEYVVAPNGGQANILHVELVEQGAFRRALKDLDVFADKHIPERYLLAGDEQRLALLQGLMDGDGSISTNGSTFRAEYSSCISRLADDVLFLVRSLGWRATVKSSKSSLDGVRKKDRHRVTFTPTTDDLPPFRLPRKAARVQADKSRAGERHSVTITAVEPVEPQDAYCIQVDSPDGLFLAGRDLVPTHNSLLAAVFSVIRALQRNPDLRIILATYASELAESHSRAARDLIDTHGTGVTDSLTGLPVEDKLGLRLARGANKVSSWSVVGGRGGLVAVGVGGPITGRPADLMIIDDPFKNMMEADSKAHRDKVEAWFSSVVLTRLSPSASIVLIQCMTGDTPVLRPDGTETPLVDLRPGDEIATYENGSLSTSFVRNWASQGYDSVNKLVFASGRQVRANARHPFLVSHDDGTTTWVRLADLKPGQRVVAASTDANARTTPEAGASHIGLRYVEPSAVCASTPRGTEASGQASCALLTAVASPPSLRRGCATAITTSTNGRRGFDTRPIVGGHAATWCCESGTESTMTSMTGCWRCRVAGVLSAASRLTRRVCPRIGTAIFALITTKRPASVPCSAMTATSAWGDSTMTRRGSMRLPIISTDMLLCIEPYGTAEVFDIEVERTENFIANGLVSHNTRWHPEDLAGKVLAGEQLLDTADRTWRRINIPAIAEAGIPDALDREPGTPMVSARDTPEAKRNFELTRKQVGERVFYALYQGNPRNPAGGIFQRSWFASRLLAVPDHRVAAVVGVDPAETGEGDEAGIIAGMLLPDGTVVLTHDRSGHYTSDRWAQEAVALALEIGAREIAIEGYTTADTYRQVVRRAYTGLHREAVSRYQLGAALTPSQTRALADIPPFQITSWRGPSKADAVARSGLISQAFETGRCRTVEFALAVFEEQAADWQAGQHQPDRVAAAVIAHDRLSALGGGTTLADPTQPSPPDEPPAWLRRRI